MKRRDDLQHISRLLSYWQSNIQNENSLGYLGSNKDSEYLAMKLLNEIFDYELVNLNDQQAYFPGIDLGDKTKAKLAFSITSRTDSKKIVEDLEKFGKHCLSKEYTNGIRFLILSPQEVKLGRVQYDKICSGFNKNEHILYIKDLSKKIAYIYSNDQEKFERIRKIMENEFPELKKNVTDIPRDDSLQNSISTDAILLDRLDRIEKSLKELLDEKTFALSKNVFRDGKYPPLKNIEESLNVLLSHLENSAESLSKESQIEGYITITDGFLFLKNKNNVKKARRYYDNKVCVIYEKLDNPSPWQERILRLRAKLLYSEGDAEEAIRSLSQSVEPKTIAFRLNFLVNSGKIEEAFSFVSSNERKVEWVCEELDILVKKGKIEEAEILFRDTQNDFEAREVKQDIEHTAYKSEVFFERLSSVMVSSLYSRAITLSKKKDIEKLLPTDLSPHSRELLKKIERYIDKIFERIPRNTADSYRVHQILLIDMSIAFLLGNMKRLDEAILDLISVKPMDKVVLSNLVMRSKFLNKSTLKKAVQLLEEENLSDYWNWMALAIIEKGLENEEIAFKALLNVIPYLETEENKIDFIISATEISLEIDKLEEIYKILKEIFPKDKNKSSFVEGIYHWHKGNRHFASTLFKKLSLEGFNDNIKAAIKFYQAINALAEEKWNDSRSLFKESLELDFHPNTLHRLLFVHAKLREDEEVITVSRQLELFGLVDNDVLALTAQANANLKRYERAEDIWRKLYERSPTNASYALGLADMLSITDKELEAFEILIPFIQPDEDFNANCLKIAFKILAMMGNIRKAFEILDSCFQKIPNDPELLHMHMETGFKVGEDEKSNRSLSLIYELQQDVKNSDKLLKSISISEIIETQKKYLEEYKDLRRRYTYGQVPRMLLSTHRRISFYFDWAFRTQDFKTRPIDKGFLVDFAIYSTNSIQVQYNKTGKDNFGPIQPRKDSKEIIIDYSALITIHRLGLFNKLTERFDKIYYSEYLKRVLKYEKANYGPNQYRIERLHRSLNKKIQEGDIIKICASPPGDEKDPIIRNLHLAQAEGIVLIDEYLDKNISSEFPEVYVLRISQLADFLHQKGWLGESKKNEIQKTAKEQPLTKPNIDDWKNKIVEDMRVLVSEATLVLMERFEINRILLQMGIQIMVEKDTAFKLEKEVINFDLREEVEKWHHDLCERLKLASGYEPIMTISEAGNMEEDEYFETVLASLKIMEQKQIPLLTDDRWIQIVGSKRAPDNQFGTDILLIDLFESKLITLEEYAQAFLKLCQWRYRYLLPDIRVLEFYAQQYKNALPGENLKSIASYFRDCMDIPGLFLGIEPTNPPISLGLTYYLRVIDTWLEFLVKIWEDDSFDEEILNEFTDWFFIYGIPDLPIEIENNRRLFLCREMDETIATKLFLSILSSDNDIRLHKLLEKSFKHIFRESINRLKLMILKKFIDSTEKTENSFPNINEEITVQALKNHMIKRALDVLYGPNLSKHPSPIGLIPLLRENDFDIKLTQPTVSEKDIERLKETLDNEIRKIKSDSGFKYEMSKFFITKYDQRQISLASLHNLIRYPSIDIKRRIFKLILLSYNISDITKVKVKKIKGKVLSLDPFEAEEACARVEEMVLRDFNYLKSLLEEPVIYNNHQEEMNEILGKIISPDLHTVKEKIPSFINKKLESKDILAEIKRRVTGIRDFGSFLDWYLEEIYFVPFDSMLAPWNIVSNFISSRKAEGMKGEISNLDVFNETKKWINTKRDPLAYIVALNITLNLRIEELKSNKTVIGDEIYYKFVERLFEILLKDDVNVENYDHHLSENIQIRWKIITELALYFLKYIDLYGNEIFEEEKKVLVSWWMAKEVEQSFLKKLPALPIEQENQWLEVTAIAFIEEANRNILLEHFLKFKAQGISISRYVTLYRGLSLLDITFSMLYSDVSHQAFCQTLEVIPPEFSNKYEKLILARLFSKSLIGEEQFLEATKENLPLLWHVPLTISAPVFFREFYSNNLKSLSNEGKTIIYLAERVTRQNFLESQISLYNKVDKSEKGGELFLLLNSLSVYFHLNGKMSYEGRTFFSQKGILDDILSLSESWNSNCLSVLLIILVDMIKLERAGWLDKLIKAIMKIDYTIFSYNLDILDEIINKLVTLALIMKDVSILNPIVERKLTNEIIKKALHNNKRLFEKLFLYIPKEYTEVLRKILHKMED